MRVLISSLLAALVAAPAAAQQKRSVLAADPRLDQKVTIAWKKATLHQALAELKRKTGVALSPDRGVVDEPVMASATSVPAREVLEQVAKLLKFTWIRYGGTPEKPGYLLFKDVAAAREEEEAISGGRRAVLEALQKEIDTYRRISRMPPEQLQRELARVDQELEQVFSGGFAGASNNPQAARRMMDGMGIRTVASPTGRAMVEILDGLSPGQWDQVLDEQPLVFSTRPAAGELPLPGGIDNRLRESSPSMPFPKSLFRTLGPQVEESIAAAEARMQQEWSRGNGFKVTIQLTLNMGAQPMGMLRVSPEPTGGTEGIGPLFTLAGMNLVAAPTLFPESKEDPAEREKRLAADPVLGKKVVFKLPPVQPQPGFLALLGNSHRVADILPAVEEAFGVRLVGDAYNRLALSVLPPSSGEIQLFKLLDQMAGVTRDWELDGATVRLKSRTWASDRRSEIPVRYMQRWLAERTRKGGVLSLDDLAEIASMLRDEQIENLMYSALEAGAEGFNDFVMVSANRDAFRFWASLLPLQRRSLMGGQAIPARMLYARQQQSLLALVQPKRGGGSMFAAFMGTRAPRTAQHLAGAVVSLEARHLDERRGGPENPPAPQPGREHAAVNVGGAPSSLYTLRVTYANGQKDEYRIPIMRTAALPIPVPPAQPMAAPEPPKPAQPE